MSTEIRQASGPDLSAVPCPACATVGALAIEPRLVARPLGTWSLAGVQLKTSAVEVAHIVCKGDGCDFIKAPSA